MRGRALFSVLFLVRLALALPAASAQDFDDSDQMSEPELLSEMQRVEEENVSNAMAGAEADAQRSLEFIAAFVESSKERAGTLLAGLRRKQQAGARNPGGTPGAYETDAQGPVPSPAVPDTEDMELSLQMLGAKSEAFEIKAASAAVRLPRKNPEAVSSRRAAYRPADRDRDLTRGQSYLDKASKRGAAGKGARLGEPQRDFLSALRDYLTELRDFRRLALSTAREAGTGKAASSAARQLEQGAKLLEAEIAGLDREIRIYEIALKMRRIEEDTWAR